MALILIIDDEADMRAILAEVLSRAGYRTLEVPDGRAGLAALATHPVDLILTDMIMPEMDGIEFLLHLRRLRSGVPIIAISGGGHTRPDSYLHAARVAGASKTLAKPFRVEDLVDAVAECLRSRAASPGPANPPSGTRAD